MAAIAIGGALGWYQASREERIYSARTSIMIWPSEGGLVPTAGDFKTSESFASVYVTLATSQGFLETVADDEDVPFTARKLRKMITATKKTDPPILGINVEHTNPATAASVSQRVAEEFINYVIELRLGTIAQFQSAAASQGIFDLQDLAFAQTSVLGSLSIIARAEPPNTPIKPNTERSVTLGIMVGLVASIGAIVLIEALRVYLPSPEEIQRRLGIQMVGTIMRWDTDESASETESLVLLNAPKSTHAEAFRQIRSNFQFSVLDRGTKSVMVTSAGPGEGKSTISSNFAISLTLIGKSVVLVDGDLRRPSVHRIFNSIDQEPGLTNYLLDSELGPSGVAHQSQVPGLDIIPSGPIPPNPSEILETRRFSELMKDLTEIYDFVVLDSPPTLVVSDSAVLSANVDAVMIVVDSSKTRYSQLQATCATLNNAQANVIGMVVNKLKRGRLGYDPYYYYNTYYQYYTEDYHPYSVNGSNGNNGHRWYGGRAVGARAKSLVSRFSRRSRDSSE